MAPETWKLRLYVTGSTPAGVRALANLQRACARWLPGEYQIEVVDLLEHPRLAVEDHIVAVPTLVKTQPPPILKIVGDLSDAERVVIGLQLRL